MILPPESPLEKGSVKIKITDGENPIYNIEVTLKDKNNKTYTKTTGIAGDCQIDDLIYGTYTIELKNIENYKKPEITEIEIKDKNQEIELKLEEKE